MFFNKCKTSIGFTILIEIISLVFLFIGGPVGKFLLEKCGWIL
jgi:hypothetical protein